MENFIKKLRDSDNAVKRRWLVVFSAIAMVFVVFIWTKYFNSLVAPIGAPQPTEQGPGEGFTFWQTFKSGLAIISQSLGGLLHSLINIFREPKDYIIQP